MRILRRRCAATLSDVEAIYRTRLAELRRVAAAVAGDRDAAPDIVQDAFVRAIRDLKGFRGEGSLEGWVWRIVVNLARNHVRDRPQFAEPVDGRVGGTNGALEAHDDRLAEAVRALPERQRLTLFLHYYADLDYATVAEVLDVALGTVAATLHAARSALRERLMSEDSVT